MYAHCYNKFCNETGINDQTEAEVVNATSCPTEDSLEFRRMQMSDKQIGQ